MADNKTYVKTPHMGGGVIYHKTLAKLVQTDDGSNVQSVLNSHSDDLSVLKAHANNKNNPHGVTLSQLGFDQNAIIKAAINAIYPVNSIKISYTNVNPGTYLQGTTWQLVSQGKYIVGADGSSSSAQTGGRTSFNMSHSHTVSSHSHSIDAHYHTIGAHTHIVQRHHHLQTIGADADNMYLYVPKNVDSNGNVAALKPGATATWKEKESVVVTTTRSTWSLSKPTKNLSRFQCTDYCEEVATKASDAYYTTGTSLTTNAASPYTTSTGGDISLNPIHLTLFIWRRTA